MRAPPRLGLLLGVVLAATGGNAAAAPRGTDPTDALLFGRALRVGRNTASRHVTPEGLLAYIHRRDATPAQLSADALKHPDVGIWTGCYAAAVACRAAVRKDRACLEEARRVAAGLDLLSAATGVEGGIARAVGRPIPGEETGKDVVPSPLGNGLWYRNDPSRDTLSGVVLGWTCLARFVDDPEVRAFARKNLGAIARRLYAGGMNLRDADGGVTTYGRLKPKVGPFENGMHAAIGCACIQAARVWDGGDDLHAAWRHLDHEGWIDAIDTQWTWLDTKITSASNMNMVHLALLSLALDGDGKPKRHALAALRDFRKKTRGWQNGGYLACALLAGQQVDRDDTVAELRATLFEMRPEEVPYDGAERDTGGPIRRIGLRPVNEWMWKVDPNREEVGAAVARPSTTRTFTRADWLFAYWLARAAGELDPGPEGAAGSDPGDERPAPAGPSR